MDSCILTCMKCENGVDRSERCVLSNSAVLHILLPLRYSGRTFGCWLWTRSFEECILCDVRCRVVADTLSGGLRDTAIMSGLYTERPQLVCHSFTVTAVASFRRLVYPDTFCTFRGTRFCVCVCVC